MGDDEQTGARFTVIIPRDLKTPKMRHQEWMAEENRRE
jgi:hypothetical protein